MVCVWLFSPQGERPAVCAWLFSSQGERPMVCVWLFSPQGERQVVCVWLFSPQGERQVVSVLLFSPQADRQMVWGRGLWWWLVCATGSGLLSLLCDCCTAVLKVGKAGCRCFICVTALQFKKQIMGWVAGGVAGCVGVCETYSTGWRVGCGV